MASSVKLAIIGCGAVTELCHLPAAQRAPEVEIVALVDRNIERARCLGDRFGVAYGTADYRELPPDVQGAIVALPHHLHAPVTIELLEKGTPVLVEKPMAVSVEQAETMVKVAEARNLPLQVGLMYRFCNGARLVKRAIEENWLGKIESFSVEWCFVYDWPVASEFFFSKEQAGGGVLLDFGSHVLDLLLWWFGNVLDVEYRDDSQGGVEAECLLKLVLQGPAGPVPGTVTLSRLRRLPYSARIVGDRFTIECDISAPTTARMWSTRSDVQGLALMAGSSPCQSLDEAYAEQLRAFAETIARGTEPMVPGKQVLGSIALMERCYRNRQPLELPWMNPIGLNGKNALLVECKRESMSL
jgi:predicted dehydrogenase